MRRRNPTGEQSRMVEVGPDEAFALVAAGAPRPFVEGAEWVAAGDAGGHGERGGPVVRCHVIEVDLSERRLVYRCKPDRDDPSFTIWTWHVEPGGDGRSRVTLGWELRPVTFVRKHLLVHLDARRIQRREAPAALAAVARA